MLADPRSLEALDFARVRERVAGQTHYGISNRLLASSYDLLAVRWMKRRMFRYQIAEKIN